MVECHLWKVRMSCDWKFCFEVGDAPKGLSGHYRWRSFFGNNDVHRNGKNLKRLYFELYELNVMWLISTSFRHLVVIRPTLEQPINIIIRPTTILSVSIMTFISNTLNWLVIWNLISCRCLQWCVVICPVNWAIKRISLDVQHSMDEWVV
jgi:hypothetical protein